MGKRLSEKNPFLRDPEKKKRLMVSAITSAQRQEGIEISDARAEEVYRIVFEEPPVAFIRLIGSTNPQDELQRVLLNADRRRYEVPRKLFQRIAGVPLCYWAPTELLELFSQNPRLDPVYSDCKQGLISSEFDQFVRYRWEVPLPKEQKKTWVPYAKGGGFSRFYGDLEYVFDWTDNGRDIKTLAASRYGSASRTVKCEEYYFRSGITWTEKTVKGFNARILPAGAIFNVAGPSAFPRRQSETDYLLGVLNSSPAQALLFCLVPSRSWGVEYVGQLPIPPAQATEAIGGLARRIHDAKAAWDEGNELSTRFKEPWLATGLREHPGQPLTEALDALLAREAAADAEIQAWYAELDGAVFDAYGLSPETRKIVVKDLGPRPPELIWPQMEGKSAEQKRMEQVIRLLSFCVKRIVEGDDDGIVPLVACNNEPPLEERVLAELGALVGPDRTHVFEGEIASELRKKVPGYRRADSIGDFLANVYFEHHVRLYKSRPIFWHLASAPEGGGTPAFAVLVHYHRFRKDALRKLRGTHVRSFIERRQRDLALARQANRTDEALEIQRDIEEAQAFDKKLQGLEEGRFPIRVPWKKAAEQPKGWDPALDDGVRVNILPLQTAGLLRIPRVVSTKSGEEADE
jgi:hypothetical protein